MKLEYIKAGGRIYIPQEAGIPKPGTSCNYPVCKIKKLLFGLWMVEYYEPYNNRCGYSFGDEDKPNRRVILYPAGIEQIRWTI